MKAGFARSHSRAVTALASSQHFLVIDLYTGQKCTGTMTGTTIVGAVQVSRRLPGLIGIIVTLHALANQFVMIYARQWAKSKDRVTIPTVIGAIHMSNRFTDDGIVIVTTDAITHHVIMINREYRQPGHCGVAVLAVAGAWDVAGRFGSGRDAVTVGAVVNDAGMVKTEPYSRSQIGIGCRIAKREQLHLLVGFTAE